MAFIITLGITARKILPPKFIALFYIGLGLSLLLASFYLLYYAIRYKFAILKFKKTN